MSPLNLIKPERQGVGELVWLLGQPQLTDYLEFVAGKVVDGSEWDLRALVDEWRAANDVYFKLEQTEAGIAESIDCKSLARSLAPRADRLRSNPWFRASFDNLPFEIIKVELDKLVVSQLQIEHGATLAAAENLGSSPSAGALFDFCLPLDRVLPPVRVQRLSGDRYIFSSPSTDFRSHRPRLLLPEVFSKEEASGPIAAMLGIGVGFGSNFLSGIRSNGRILLQNGYHRAYALRRRGLRHGYCVVEDVTRKDELRLTATSEVADDPEFYFAARRPPLLKDFFDPRLAKRLPVLPVETTVEVEIKVRSGTATCLSETG